MKSLKHITLSIALATGVLFSQMTVNAADSAAPASNFVAYIGVIDAQKVLADLPVMKKVQEQLEKMRKDFAAEVSGYETELRKAEKALVEAQKKLSEAEFAKKREAFEKRINEVQTVVENRKSQLDKALADAMKKINEKVEAAIAQVAKSKNLNIILPSMSVAYSAEALDVSKEVSEIVKKTLTDVKIETPKK